MDCSIFRLSAIFQIHVYHFRCSFMAKTMFCFGFAERCLNVSLVFLKTLVSLVLRGWRKVSLSLQLILSKIVGFLSLLFSNLSCFSPTKLIFIWRPSSSTLLNLFMALVASLCLTNITSPDPVLLPSFFRRRETFLTGPTLLKSSLRSDSVTLRSRLSMRIRHFFSWIFCVMMLLASKLLFVAENLFGILAIVFEMVVNMQVVCLSSRYLVLLCWWGECRRTKKSQRKRL